MHKGLGRIYSPDERDRKYLIPRRNILKMPTRRVWYAGPILDQGSTPQCVGYAGWGWLRGGPILNKPPFTPTKLYDEARKDDEWEGENYDGSSTRGLFKALVRLGFVSEYIWAFDAEALVGHVLAEGPVCVGTDWLGGMDDPDPKTGFIRATGGVRGGHEWRVIGADRHRKCPDGTVGAARMANSWGYDWGERGRAWISIADLDKLIKNQGEGCTAKEVLVKKGS